MARQLVVLALLLLALVGATSATSLASQVEPMPAMSPSENDTNGIVGTIDGPEDDAAPIGAPVSPGTFVDLAPSPSGANALEISAAIGVAAAIGAATFF
ncbi:hypothetical protein NMG60_11030852 [Bertholletia excelsa]